MLFCNAQLSLFNSLNSCSHQSYFIQPYECEIKTKMPTLFCYTKVDGSDTAICSFQAFDNNFNTQNHSGF